MIYCVSDLEFRMLLIVGARTCDSKVQLDLSTEAFCRPSPPAAARPNPCFSGVKRGDGGVTFRRDSEFQGPGMGDSSSLLDFCISNPSQDSHQPHSSRQNGDH